MSVSPQAPGMVQNEAFPTKKRNMQRNSKVAWSITSTHSPTWQPPTPTQTPAPCWPVSSSEKAASPTKPQHCPQMRREEPVGLHVPLRSSSSTTSRFSEERYQSKVIWSHTFWVRTQNVWFFLAQEVYGALPGKTRHRHTRCCSIRPWQRGCCSEGTVALLYSQQKILQAKKINNYEVFQNKNSWALYYLNLTLCK